MSLQTLPSPVRPPDAAAMDERDCPEVAAADAPVRPAGACPRDRPGRVALRRGRGGTGASPPAPRAPVARADAAVPAPAGRPARARRRVLRRATAVAARPAVGAVLRPARRGGGRPALPVGPHHAQARPAPAAVFPGAGPGAPEPRAETGASWPSSAGRSLLLLGCGYAAGCTAGVVCGVLIGWSPRVRYWGMPVLKVVGPIPATALVPLAMMLFPTAFLSGAALIAAGRLVPGDDADRLGRSPTSASRTWTSPGRWGPGGRYLIFRVAIPAAMPSIFIGLFMGLGASFLTLIVAETVGAKSGLGLVHRLGARSGPTTPRSTPPWSSWPSSSRAS